MDFDVVNPIDVIGLITSSFLQINNHLEKEHEFFDAANKFLAEVKDKRLIPSLLEDIIINQDLLCDIAGRSYKHVNHFSKVLLIDDPDPRKCRLTLHIWRPPFSDGEMSQELIHNHRFSFCSLVLAGVQVHRVFSESSDISDTKTTFQKYKYLPSQTGNIHDCFLVGDVQLDEGEIFSVYRDQHYAMKYLDIHKVELPDGETPIVSLVVRGPRERDFTNTYNTFYPRNGISSHVPMYTKDQLKGLIIVLP